MEVSGESLRELLGGIPGVTCLPMLVQGKVAFALSAGPQRIEMLGVPEEGGVVQLRTLILLKAPERRFRSVLLQALLSMNYQYKIVKFAFDASDGEVVAYLDLAVVGTGLTKRQLQRVVHQARSTIVAAKIRCERIIQTGIDPGDMSDEAVRQVAADVLRDHLGALALGKTGADAAKGARAPGATDGTSKQEKKPKGKGSGLLLPDNDDD